MTRSMESIQAQRERLSIVVAAASGGAGPASLAPGAPAAASTSAADAGGGAAVAASGPTTAGTTSAPRAQRPPRSDSGGDANDTRLLQSMRRLAKKSAVDRSPLLASSATDIARAGEFERWEKILARRCALLSRVGLFRRLNAVQLRAVAARMSEHCVTPAEVIIQQGQTVDRSCHVLLRGTAIVESWNTELGHKAGGIPKVLATLKTPGTLLGEVRV